MNFQASLRNLVNYEENLSSISEVEFEFCSIQKTAGSKTSKKITVPGIDAQWWLETLPVYPIARSNLYFPHAENPETTWTPEIKLKIEFHDETIYKSNLFTVTINVEEWRSKHVLGYRSKYEWTMRPHLKFYENFSANINSTFLEVSNKSFVNGKEEYCYCCETHYDRDGKTSKYLQLNLRCKLTFTFTGDFAWSFTGAIKGLKNITSNSIGNLLKDDSFSDFTIIAGDESFKVHKCVLANASSVFKTMFTCGLDETKLNSTTFSCTPEITKHFLRFIYEGALPSNLQLKSLDFCFKLYEIAHRYEIRFLPAICKSYALQLTVDTENALKIYEFASTYEIKPLLDSSWHIIKTKMLDLNGPCNPKPLLKIKEIIAKKAELLEMYKRTLQSFVEVDDEVTEDPQTGDKKRARH